MRYFPSIKPIRTPAIGLTNGMSERYRAHDAPVIAITSGSLSASAEMTDATICVSNL